MRIILLALIVFSAQAHDEEEPFADVLHRVIRASRENFRPVQGARIEMHPGSRSYYQAKVNLPGTTECRIDEQPRWIYSCQWRGARCDKLLADTAAALGQEWSRKGSLFTNTGRYKATEVNVARGCSLAISVARASNK